MSLGYPILGTMMKRKLAPLPCPYPTDLSASIVTTLTTLPLSAPTLTIYALTISHALSPHITLISANTARLICVVIFWITSWMLFQKAIGTWMRETSLIDTGKYQGRGGVMS
jgi:hypothetical protein